MDGSFPTSFPSSLITTGATGIGTSQFMHVACKTALNGVVIKSGKTQVIFMICAYFRYSSCVAPGATFVWTYQSNENPSVEAIEPFGIHIIAKKSASFTL